MREENFPVETELKPEENLSSASAAEERNLGAEIVSKTETHHLLPA